MNDRVESSEPDRETIRRRERETASIMAKLAKIDAAVQRHSSPPRPPEDPPIDDKGGADDNGPMEARVIKLEEFAQDTRDRLTRIETRLDQTATKADLAEGISSMVKWVVGTAVGLGVAGITVMTFVLNNATPKTAPAMTPTPIIINVPASTPPPTTAPAAK